MVVSSYQKKTNNMKYYIEEQAWEVILSFFKERNGIHNKNEAKMRQFIEVKLMPPQFVKPYVKTNKDDQADAEAICEAVARPNMRFVPIKTIEQQDILSIHRVRERLVKNRTALANERIIT
jgi:ATP sulfurylase